MWHVLFAPFIIKPLTMVKSLILIVIFKVRAVVLSTHSKLTFEPWPQTDLWWCPRWLRLCPLARAVSSAGASALRSDPPVAIVEALASVDINRPVRCLYISPPVLKYFCLSLSRITLLLTDVMEGSEIYTHTLSSFSEDFFRCSFSCSASYRERKIHQ